MVMEYLPHHHGWGVAVHFGGVDVFESTIFMYTYTHLHSCKNLSIDPLVYQARLQWGCFFDVSQE